MSLLRKIEKGLWLSDQTISGVQAASRPLNSRAWEKLRQSSSLLPSPESTQHPRGPPGGHCGMWVHRQGLSHVSLLRFGHLTPEEQSFGNPMGSYLRSRGNRPWEQERELVTGLWEIRSDKIPLQWPWSRPPHVWARQVVSVYGPCRQHSLTKSMPRRGLAEWMNKVMVRTRTYR